MENTDASDVASANSNTVIQTEPEVSLPEPELSLPEPELSLLTEPELSLPTVPEQLPETNREQPNVESIERLETDHKSIKIATCFKCAVWSKNPEKPDWNVKLMLHSDKPLDLSERIGFIVLSNLGVSDDDPVPDMLKTFNFKFHSRHDHIDNKIFRELVSRGTYFTKLELVGGFFNNAYLCPSNMTTSESEVEPIYLPNLEKLIIKTKITAALKGSDKAMQEAYYQQHIEHCDSIKSRTAKNLWYLLKSFECTKLNLLEIQDSINWEDEGMNTNGFNYWEQPLIDFLQRHASSLKTFKATPLVISDQQQAQIGFNSNEGVPGMQDLLFWMKLPLKYDSCPEPEKEIQFSKKLNRALRPWRQFLEAQSDLQTLAWITDAQNPWPFTRRDFLRLCQNNPRLETLLMALHGDEAFKESHNIKDPAISFSVRDFQIDTVHLHGMSRLKVLSIGCYNSDPQIKNFCFFNLHLLSPSLENVHLFGIRVLSSDLESLAKLPTLKRLSIVQPSKQFLFNQNDEVNKNAEGVTDSVLKKLINSRSLEKLIIVGFSVKVVDHETEKKEKEIPKRPSPNTLGVFVGICGGMCFPSARDSDELLEETSNTNEGQVSLVAHYEPLKTILKSLDGVADISDVKNESGEQLITMLRMGRCEINEPFNI